MKPIDDFFGKDPLAAERALGVLAGESPAAIEQLIPFPQGRATRGPAGDLRLARLTRHWGDAIVPHLARCLRDGSWTARLGAAPCFGGLRGSRAAEEALAAILDEAGDFDAERQAIEAFGWLGADGWAWDVDHHVRTGRWKRHESERDDDVSTYAYGKLWSYGISALARMAAQAADADRVRILLDLLDQALRRQAKVAPNVGPDGTQITGRVAHHFNERQVDALLAKAQAPGEERLRKLYLSLIGTIAPVRVARRLLALTTSAQVPAAVRDAASIALGDIRVREVGALLAEALRDDAVDPSSLTWPASTLFAAGGIDWDDNPAFFAAMAQGSDETAQQLRYSLAVRGDRRCLEATLADLDDAQPYRRWPAALSVARLLGPAARPHLRHRADDAGEDLERAGMLAAVVRAGDHGRVDDLHAALQQVSYLHGLRVVWRIEIVDALRCAPGGQERFEAWCGEALLNERQQRYFDEWGRHPAVPARVAAAAPEPETSTVGAAAPLMAQAAAATSLQPPPAAGPLPHMGRPGAPAKVFISYSHRDKVWLKRFQDMQAPLQRSGKLELWDDTRMAPGRWQVQIEQAMHQADAALFLVSSHFLSSEFVNRKELPVLLDLAESKGLRVVWVLLDPCFWKQTRLSDYQGVNADRPLTKVVRAGDRSEIILEAWRQVLGLD